MRNLIDIVRLVVISFLAAVSLLFGIISRFVIAVFALIALLLTWAMLRLRPKQREGGLSA